MENRSKKFITTNGKLFSHKDLLRVEETHDKTLLIFTTGKVEESVLSIDALEWELPKDVFIRIHPNHLINRNFRKKIFTIHSDWMEMDNGEKLPISDKLFPPKKSTIKILKHLFKK